MVGLGLRSLALHAPAAFISSLAASGCASPGNIQLQKNVASFNNHFFMLNVITVDTVLPSSPSISTYFAQIAGPSTLSVYPFFGCPCKQGTSPICICSTCKFLDLSGPFYGPWSSSGSCKMSNSHQMVAWPGHIRRLPLSFLFWHRP